MTLRIETMSDGATTTIRLIGEVNSEHLTGLTEQIRSIGSRTVLDLDEVTLVDVEVVRFLGRCESEGIESINCAPYVREWMIREQP